MHVGILVATVCTGVVYATFNTLLAILYVIVAVNAETYMEWLVVTLSFLMTSLVAVVGRGMSR